MDNTLAEFLTGLNMENYIEKFEKCSVNMKIFKTLNKDDLSHLGVGEHDANSLLNFLQTLPAHRILEKPVMSDVQADIILNNIVNETEKIRSSTLNLSDKLKKIRPLDLYDNEGKFIPSLIKQISEKLVEECDVIINKCDSITRTENQMKNTYRNNKLKWLLCETLIVLLVTFFICFNVFSKLTVFVLN